MNRVTVKRTVPRPKIDTHARPITVRRPKNKPKTVIETPKNTDIVKSKNNNISPKFLKIIQKDKDAAKAKLAIPKTTEPEVVVIPIENKPVIEQI